MASEVRDDVPAMLSEGEYIVPADVVRYYGVKFFEELRGQAKEGLMDMEQNGRIGGEPVDAPMGGDELSPEEMQMLAELTGMYGGGMVQKGYQTGGMVTGDPRMIAYNMANYASSIPGNRTASFNVGGVVAPMTQEGFMQQGQQGSQFQVPRSIFAPSAPAQPATAPTTPVTLYGPTGDVIVLMIPTDQEQYNQLIAQGYTTEPRPTQAPVDAGGRDDGPVGIDEPEVTAGGGFRLNEEKLEALQNDPLGFGTAALQSGAPMGLSSRQMTGAGGLLGGVPGAIAGGLVGAALELDNVAQAKAALAVAESQGLAGTPAYTELQNAVNTAVGNLSPGAGMLNRLGFGTGKSYTEQALGQTTAPAAAPATAKVPVAGGGATSTPVSDAGLGRAASMTEAERAAGAAYAATGSDRAETWSGGSVASDQSAPSTSRTSEEARSAAQSAADRTGTSMATGGRATGGLVAKRKKPVAKKK
jgi:hypothetical protein